MNEGHDPWLDNVDSECLDKTDELSGRVETWQDLAKFIFLLAQGFKDGNFEPQSVHDYLHGAGALTRSLNHWYRNNEIDEDPEVPTWRMFGWILRAAFDHS